MAFWNRNKNSQGMRVIKTARDEGSINEAAKNGFKPLIKKVEPSDEIYSQYSIGQNKKTGEIEMGIHNDFDSDFEKVIEWTSYYPYNFMSPFAAYLIPKNIKIGERVLIEDLIQDYIGMIAPIGTFRLKSCEAIWNGKDLDIQYDPEANVDIIIG